MDAFDKGDDPLGGPGTLSKGPAGGQGKLRALRAPEASLPVKLAVLVTVLALGGCGGRGEQVCDTPSNLPVPRFVSLKFGEVYARKGPGEDHRILWVWRSKGMPLEVVAETSDWRRVRGPDGVAAWAHKRGIDGRLTVMRIKPGPLAMLAAPKADARVVAYLAPNAVAVLDRSEGSWRRIKASGRTGWAPASELWGAGGPTPCRPRED
jgi:SH3-like domain-containing protein